MMNKSATTNEGTEKHIMDLLKVEASQIFSGHALANLSIDKYESEILDALTYTLWTMIPAEHMKTATHEFHLDYPATLWQHFKQQYFTDWLKRYFPVRYNTIRETVRFDAYALYPKIPRIFECGDYRQIIMTREREGE